jgi:hypothetical protein
MALRLQPHGQGELPAFIQCRVHRRIHQVTPGPKLLLTRRFERQLLHLGALQHDELRVVNEPIAQQNRQRSLQSSRDRRGQSRMDIEDGKRNGFVAHSFSRQTHDPGAHLLGPGIEIG